MAGPMSGKKRRSASAEPRPAAVSISGVPDRPRHEEPDQVMARNVEGVRIERLVGYHDQRGSLVPFMDFTKPFWSEPIVHAYEFTIRPGRIKGWGMHRLQADRYFVQTGDLRVVLFDGREGSPTKGRFCQFWFTGGTYGLLHIPAGVWHATQNWGTTLGRIVNFGTVRFDTARPDKARIDPHSGAIPFDWTIRDG
jgi:dTDP-4-dehydrorhamnose 3,5-epimerase